MKRHKELMGTRYIELFTSTKVSILGLGFYVFGGFRVLGFL